MHQLSRRDWEYTGPCPYVPTEDYDWKLTSLSVPEHCGTLAWNPVVYSLVAAFQAGTFLVGFELLVQLFFQFKKKSLYFWSILVTACGAILFQVASFVLEYAPKSAVLAAVLLNVGWVAMTTGFSIVLYSRLHFLDPSPKMLRTILIVIIVDAFLFHAPVFVAGVLCAAQYSATTWKVYIYASYTEIAFTVQETVITTLYVYLFLKYTKDRKKEPATRSILWQLFLAEFVVFTTDIILNVLLYTDYYLPRQMTQAFMVVWKLKIEFLVLNSLIKYSQSKSTQQMDLNWAGGADDSVTPAESNQQSEAGRGKEKADV